MKKYSYKNFAILFCALMLAIPLIGNAQSSSIIYGSSRNPLMNAVNPAFFPAHSRLYIALPNANIGFDSPLAYSSIFQYDSASNTTYINANNILDTLSTDGNIRLATNIHAVGLGLDFDRFFITASTQAKVDFGFALPSGLVTFLNEGNYGHTGDDYIELIDGDLISARAYAEAAIGFGIRLTDRFTIGARAKFLMGYLDLSNNGSSARLYTAEDYSSITGVANLDMNLTSILEKEDDGNGGYNYSINSYISKNTGVNFDLGIRYSTDFFELSASVIDLGPGIHWTDGIQRVVSKGGSHSFTFSGLDVSDILQGGEMDTTYLSQLMDSLSSLTEYELVDGGEDYWTTIPTKVNLGGMIHFTQGFSAGLHFHGEFSSMGNYTNTSALARINIRDWVEVVASASVLSNNGHIDWFNPGFGISLTPFRAFQVYAILDYISNFYLVDAKQINMTFGLNLFFGSSSSR